ncbi:MAG: C-terminal binding protein [Pseudomonadota bacterium]
MQEKTSQKNLPLVVVLEPGYPDYEAERSVIASFGMDLAVVATDDDARVRLGDLNPTALLIRERPFGAGLMDVCPNLRLIVRYGVGVDNIDLGAARDRGIRVANVPSYGAEHEVSDHALALYLAIARRIAARDSAIRKSHWDMGMAENMPGRRAVTLGLIGFGRIGRQVLRRFRGLDLARALVSDPALSDEEAAQIGVERTDIDTICRSADAISLHLPLTPETRHIIDRRRIALMGPTTVLVNTSRGGLIDEAALAEALTERRIFGAGLDVFEVEPLSADSPLRDAPNAILTDHTAWCSQDAIAGLQSQAAAEIQRFLEGREPLNWVNAR